MKIKCGDANLKGNIQLTYKGGCRNELDIKDAYRCVGCGGCGGWFHYDCILKHFELEKGHDNARYALGELKKWFSINPKYRTKKRLLEIIEKGLKPTKRLN